METNKNVPSTNDQQSFLTPSTSDVSTLRQSISGEQSWKSNRASSETLQKKLAASKKGFFTTLFDSKIANTVEIVLRGAVAGLVSMLIVSLGTVAGIAIGSLLGTGGMILGGSICGLIGVAIAMGPIIIFIVSAVTHSISPFPMTIVEALKNVEKDMIDNKRTKKETVDILKRKYNVPKDKRMPLIHPLNYMLGKIYVSLVCLMNKDKLPKEEQKMIEITEI